MRSQRVRHDWATFTLRTRTTRLSSSSLLFQHYWRREAVEVVGTRNQVEKVPPEAVGGLTALSLSWDQHNSERLQSHKVASLLHTDWTLGLDRTRSAPSCITGLSAESDQCWESALPRSSGGVSPQDITAARKASKGPKDIKQWAQKTLRRCHLLSSGLCIRHVCPFLGFCL